MAGTFSSSRFSHSHILLFLCVFLFSGDLRSCISGSFKFDIHHRYSDAVNKILDPEGLPEKHSASYYAAMVHRDRLVHGRRLATTNDQTPLTFIYGNDTYQISQLGFLYYANISVGTPSSSYMVALDTGSDLFWLPCECTTCPTYLNTSRGEKVGLNHYSPKESTTSKSIPCSSSLCELGSQCSSPSNTCPYQIHYLSANTSSTGYLVQDVLHLVTDDSNLKPVDANIALGCGRVVTGIFAENAAPNGLLGLGLEQISVPSLLASQGLTSNSFSMCFAADGIGRIDFGDAGTSNQRQTPINPMKVLPSYNVSFTQIKVGGKVNNAGFTAIFDSGTSFTYLNDPVYSLITEQFDAGMNLKRFQFEQDFPFEFCYQLPSSVTTYERPILNFTMKGGDSYDSLDPLLQIPVDDVGNSILCLGIVKSTDSIDLIGQNFMTGYRMIFNRDKMVLGWVEADCSDHRSGTPAHSPPTKSPPADSPPEDSPPADSPPEDSPPADSPPEDSPPSNTPPKPKVSGPGITNSTVPRPRAGDAGGARRLNPVACVFTVILAIFLAVF